MRRCALSKSLLCWLLVLGARQAFAQPSSVKTAPPNGSIYWIFLTTGKSTQGVERSEIEKMQAAHLANFGRLHQEGKLFAAGPMADPQKKMRGIVVATASDLKSLEGLFDADPYVKQGYMTIDAIKMEIAVGKFQHDVDPKSLAEYRLVLLEKSTPDGPDIDAEMQKANLAYCESMHDADRLKFAGWFSVDKRSRRGVLIFRKLDDAMLKSLVDALPAVKSNAWNATIYPLYMSEGIVK